MNKILLRLRYPKLILLGVSFLLGFLIYFDQNNFHFHTLIDKAGYWGIFLAGAFLSHGFTLGPGIAALLIVAQETGRPFWLVSLIATLGAIIGNGITYNLLRISYHQELEELSRLPFFKRLQEWSERHTPNLIKKYLFPVFAGIISATPLPDEFSILLIKASQGVSITAFTIITALVSIFGVTVILLLGRILAG